MVVIRDTDRPSMSELRDHPPLEHDQFYGGDWLAWLNDLPGDVEDSGFSKALDWLVYEQPETARRVIAHAAGLHESHSYLMAQAVDKNLFATPRPDWKPDLDDDGDPF